MNKVPFWPPAGPGWLRGRSRVPHPRRAASPVRAPRPPPGEHHLRGSGLSPMLCPVTGQRPCAPEGPREALRPTAVAARAGGGPRRAHCGARPVHGGQPQLRTGREPGSGVRGLEPVRRGGLHDGRVTRRAGSAGLGAQHGQLGGLGLLAGARLRTGRHLEGDGDGAGALVATARRSVGGDRQRRVAYERRRTHHLRVPHRRRRELTAGLGARVPVHDRPGTGCDRNTVSTLARWLSSTSSARWPLRRASWVRQNAHASRSLSCPGSNGRIASSHASATW